jgi:hypothetical protein
LAGELRQRGVSKIPVGFSSYKIYQAISVMYHAFIEPGFPFFIGVRRGVSKEVEDSRDARNGHEAVPEVAAHRE